MPKVGRKVVRQPRPTQHNTHLSDAALEGFSGHRGGSVDGAAVVVGPPRRAVDVDVLRVEPQRLRLDGVRHVSVQHAHS